jgi:hypothetical protein
VRAALIDVGHRTLISSIPMAAAARGPRRCWDLM